MLTAAGKKIHFIGIGGAGMAPLAGLCADSGCPVSGSDLELNSKCAVLTARGVKISAGHAAENVPPECAVVVKSSAVPPENPELLRAQQLGCRILLRGEALAEIAAGFQRVAAVSGSHGKSSITAALVRILLKCGYKPGFMVGAAVKDLAPWSCGSGKDIFVTEADESDGTHVCLKNYLGIVPNVEDDHAWSVGGKEVLENNFRKFAANSRHLVYIASPLTDRLFAAHPRAERIVEIPENFAGLTGFQAQNSYLAYRSAVALGCDPRSALAAAADYPAVERRMTVHLQSEKLMLVEDYAHHPTEVAKSLEFLRRAYPGYHLKVVFQPHRYARLERYFADFARELQAADELLVVPVFAAWSESGKVDGEALAAAAGGSYCGGEWQEIAQKTLQELPEKTLIAVLGAGDINRIIPLMLTKMV